MNKKSGENNIYIGQGVNFTGNISVPEEAIIDGEINGNLTAALIFVGPSGHVNGKLTAQRIEVHGEISDQIFCTSIFIGRTAVVNGVLEYKEIEIQRGSLVSVSISQKTQETEFSTSLK